MKRFPNQRVGLGARLLAIVLGASLAASTPALAATVALATAPLATSTTTSVKPNLLFVLDDSGSMAWSHMPDDTNDGGSAVSFNFGFYGGRSSQCNQVYYDPAVTYKPPIKADGTSYANASFTAAWTNGFNTGAGTVNLDTSFRALTESSSSITADDTTSRSAYYYAYSGSQTAANQKRYHDTTSTFFSECGSALSTSPGQDVFNKRTISTTAVSTTLRISGTDSTSVSSIKVNGVELMSGTSTASTSSSTVATNIAAKITLNGFSASASGSIVTITGPNTASKYTPVITKTGNMTLTPDVFPDGTATGLTNFANWYSYYRTRILMMKSAAGHAFSKLDASYRVGLMKINSSSTPTRGVDVFSGTTSGTPRYDWFDSLYNTTPSGSTPLRTALSNAGRYYAGKLSGTDPVQYSCQQNFTILSTDGYWNTGNGFMLDGTTPVGNQDGTASRPMYDGAQSGTTVTITYTRNSIYTQSVRSTVCSSRKQEVTQPQIGSCAVTVSGTPTGSESCTPSWTNNGTATTGACVSSSYSYNTSAVETSRVTTPGTVGGSSDNLADIAMYYYQTDLRTSALGNCTGAVSGEDVCTNNVFVSSSDNNTKQHMTTFTLGLGASGKMLYSPSYLTDISGDFVSVKLGSTASSSVCTWQTAGTVCNWPVPGMSGSDGLIENIDDLWHAAINGRGAYFSATSPTSLSEGLANALAGLNMRRGAAAAAATSTLNPIAGNNYAFVASYTTLSWKGNLEARGINTDTGVINESATWCIENVAAGSCAAPGTITSETSGNVTTYYCVTPNSVTCTDGILDGTDCKVQVPTACTGTMNALVTASSDTRNIYTSSGTALTPFNAAYAAANPTFFSAATISGLSQWSTLTATQQTAAAGTNLINFLRGQYGYEDRASNAVADRLYRYRDAIMGDALESQPAFLSAPIFSYPYPGYLTFKSTYASRAGSVLIGANGGMMHSFDASTGVERWAYVPSMVIPNLWKLADKNYAALHTNYVNGSPIISDICTANCTDDTTAVWKTIMVAGLNAGGRGYYALDITNPTAPILLWELTTSTGIGTVTDDDIGYSYGHPIVTRKADGTWVVLVTSGYNNTSPGDGKGYLYVLNAATGAIISKISTGAGNATDPSGLAKITAWNTEPAGNKAGYTYGGDLQGNVWRFDINDATVTAAIGTGSVMKFAELYSDTAGTQRQPVTATPVLGTIGGKRIVFIGTGKYLETGDLTTTQKQTQYAIKDDDATTTLVNPRNSLVQQTLIDNPDGTATRIGSSNSVNFNSGLGWYVDFPDTGERVNIDGKLVQGVLLIPTTVPTNTACSPGGYGWLNYLDYKTGGAVNVLTATKYSAPIVGVNVYYIQGRPVVSVVTSSDATGDIEKNIEFPSSTPTFQNKRVTWRELIQ